MIIILLLFDLNMVGWDSATCKRFSYAITEMGVNRVHESQIY